MNELISNDLVKRIFEKLEVDKLTLSVAESCTGGLIANWITDVPGSSRYFMGGVVSYSNDAKIDVLKVERDLIIRYGAVSEQVASQMAEGARRVMKADIGVSTTGIAGPDGGTAEKPVGLCYIGISFEERTNVQKHIFQGSRLQIKEAASLQALGNLLADLYLPI
ncbi:CinA family protein [bacterium]|nr:CinA family protein [bacterium]